MKLPRDISGEGLARILGRSGYKVTRQTGSHLRLTTMQKGEHHITIPRHAPLKIGTLSKILADVACHLEIPKEQLAAELFAK
jgi:predicted RNA binding protein YcfA (HicA-like mRNA interferase family)